MLSGKQTLRQSSTRDKQGYLRLKDRVVRKGIRIKQTFKIDKLDRIKERELIPTPFLVIYRNTRYKKINKDIGDQDNSHPL